MLTPGNIDLSKRPVVKNGNGYSTVRSAGFNFDGVETLLPTVSPDGRLLSNDEAVELYRKTGQHLGKFISPQASTDYAENLHLAQADQYASKGKNVMAGFNMFGPGMQQQGLRMPNQGFSGQGLTMPTGPDTGFRIPPGAVDQANAPFLARFSGPSAGLSPMAALQLANMTGALNQQPQQLPQPYRSPLMPSTPYAPRWRGSLF